MNKRVIELGETNVVSLNLQGNGGPDEIVFFNGRLQTWTLNEAAVGALRSACVDERTVRLYAEVEDDDE